MTSYAMRNASLSCLRLCVYISSGTVPSMLSACARVLCPARNIIVTDSCETLFSTTACSYMVKLSTCSLIRRQMILPFAVVSTAALPLHCHRISRLSLCLCMSVISCFMSLIT